jgi:hypothetical protein
MSLSPERESDERVRLKRELRLAGVEFENDEPTRALAVKLAAERVVREAVDAGLAPRDRVQGVVALRRALCL